jgi:PAS domain S-box-containing protein
MENHHDSAREPGPGIGILAAPLVWGEGLARALVAHSADIILVLTADHICRFASPAVCDRLGYAPEDVLGADVIPLHHPDDLPRAAAMLADAAAHPGRPAQCEVRLRHRDGSWRWMAVIATNRLEDPAVGGIVCNLREVTERIEAALAAVEAHQAQEMVSRDLERLASAKSDFLRLLAHDLKNPLAAMAGNAELIAMESPDRPLVLESAQVIQNEARHLARLIDDLLLLDQMEVAELVLRRQEVDLNALVRDTIDRLRRLTAERDVRLILEPGLARVQTDPERLVQVVINLVGNAIKFSPNGGPVTVRTTREDGGVLFSVRDEGVGIPATALPTIFDRYRRAQSGAARGIVGTGLGLTIVREIVRLHGGEVWAESVEGEGSTFYVRLPQSPAMNQP